MTSSPTTRADAGQGARRAEARLSHAAHSSSAGLQNPSGCPPGPTSQPIFFQGSRIDLLFFRTINGQQTYSPRVSRARRCTSNP